MTIVIRRFAPQIRVAAQRHRRTRGRVRSRASQTRRAITRASRYFFAASGALRAIGRRCLARIRRR
ncbi:hypothetical protein [Lysobacter enzymogenes]|uniref:hypothetical protein n=1 Tax=Lysobacter enzymogenes TaxID=69 RepID=UPI0011162158|nr:hypothetical protein [Lysobacter enzymogenes]UZW63217.1 hypothetical protein BV903_013420 [Lysobacter enzymogenes]